MESIDIMINEHNNIRRMLKVIRSLSYKIMTLEEFDIEDIGKIIDFVRIYADKHHHKRKKTYYLKP